MLSSEGITGNVRNLRKERSSACSRNRRTTSTSHFPNYSGVHFFKNASKNGAPESMNQSLNLFLICLQTSRGRPQAKTDKTQAITAKSPREEPRRILPWHAFAIRPSHNRQESHGDREWESGERGAEPGSKSIIQDTRYGIPKNDAEPDTERG
jgi:hypothetical protein